MAYESFGGQSVKTVATNPNNKVDTKLTFSRGSIKYENPFFDMTSTYIPVRLKSLLRFIASFVLGDGLVSQCINKMSEYPITKLIYEQEEGKEVNIKNDKTTKFWKELFENKLNIKKVLKQAGMDYYAYGNSIISINYPFRRELKCPRCKTWHNIDSLKYEFKGFKFFSKCKHNGCDYRGQMEAKDVNTKEMNDFNIVHWDLINMDIKYNNLSDQHFYYYTIPIDMKTAIRRGDKDILKGTRLEFIDAVKENKQVKLMSDNVFHLKRPAPQYVMPAERGWGIPVVMPVMKDIFHTQVLKKANEMISFDHIVPLRVLFPQGTGDVSPHMTTNLSNWRGKIEEEISKWRRDPNYVSIVPFPVGVQNIGGDSKMLMITPELNATEDKIITGIGIIPEIVRGGASWSGSNVSLRVVENTFLNHREDLHDLLNFLINKIAIYYEKSKINIRMSDFKMADDLQKKKLMIDSARGRSSEAILSKKTAIKEFGFDSEKEYENKQEEIKEIMNLKTDEYEGEAEAQGAASIINALYNADAQMKAVKRQNTHEMMMQQEQDKQIEKMKEESAPATEQEVNNASTDNRISLPNLILILTNRFAKLVKTDIDEFKIRMIALKNSMPNLYSEVFSNLKEMNLIERDLKPDLENIPEEQAGNVPTYQQSGVNAESPPSPVEAGASPSVINNIPEAKPPRSSNSSI